MSVTDIRMPAGRALAHRAAALLARIREAQRRHAIYRQTRAELSRLSARELADLDIAPGRIDEIAREAAARA